MRRFIIVQDGDTLAEGVVLSSGKTAMMHWLYAGATSTWSVEDLEHLYGEQLVYVDV